MRDSWRRAEFKEVSGYAKVVCCRLKMLLPLSTGESVACPNCGKRFRARVIVEAKEPEAAEGAG